MPKNKKVQVVDLNQSLLFYFLLLFILAAVGGVSKSQMIRYENKGVQPPADILKKLADILGTSVDFLINGNSDEKAKATLKNTELLQKFKEIEAMPEQDQISIINVINAYIRDYKTRQAYSA
jgi:transcriptional regulator with XRE-family HTH domain